MTVKAELFGSLGATGVGHGSDKAVILGLEGEPETVDTDAIPAGCGGCARKAAAAARAAGDPFSRATPRPAPAQEPALPPERDAVHGLRRGRPGAARAAYYSVGGGFVVDEAAAGADRIKPDDTALPYPFLSAEELLRLCAAHGLSISALMLENEQAWRTKAEIRERLLAIWQVMQDCVRQGCRSQGVLPGARVRRRAAELHRQLSTAGEAGLRDPLNVMDWVNLYALAVNEENAAGGRVVTAPTNGAAGIVPAVLHYYVRFCPGADEEGVIRFLLTAGAIGILYKENASISGPRSAARARSARPARWRRRA